MNLFEMMQQAQNGQAMQNLARQYGLSQQQTQAAIDALLPAFSMGLQRQAQNPYAFGNLAQMMTASPFGRFYDADGDGVPDGARSAGNDVLSQLFGSPEVSRAVAAQAAATSGVSQAILKQMLPVIAAMVMGGLFKNAGNSGLGGMLGQFAEMMRGQVPGMQPPQPAPQAQAPGSGMSGNPWGDILGGMFGGQPGAPQRPQAAPQPGPQAANPFDPGGILGQILTGMLGGAAASGGAEPQPAPKAETRRQPDPEPEPEPAEAPPSDTRPGAGSIGLDALDEMFKHGRQVQDSHQDALKSILDAMLGGGAPKR